MVIQLVHKVEGKNNFVRLNTGSLPDHELVVMSLLGQDMIALEDSLVQHKRASTVSYRCQHLRHQPPATEESVSKLLDLFMQSGSVEPFPMSPFVPPPGYAIEMLSLNNAGMIFQTQMEFDDHTRTTWMLTRSGLANMECIHVIDSGVKVLSPPADAQPQQLSDYSTTNVLLC